MTPRGHDWEYLLDTLPAIEVLILEQIYVVHKEPLKATDIQGALGYLNVCPRTITRHVETLAKRELLNLVFSCETFANPIQGLSGNVGVLVRIWRHRQERSLALQRRAAGAKTELDVI